VSNFVNNDVASGNIVYASDHNTQGALLAAVLNGGIDNANIASNAAISTSKLASDGFLASWSSWTPTFTNVSGGAITYAKYSQEGKTIHFRIKYTLAGANISGAILFTLPIAIHADYGANDTLAGAVSFLDNGAAGYTAQMLVSGTANTIELRPVGAGGTWGTYTTAASSTVPHTWASGDFFQCSGTYEAA
jgi:hypothetical protein